MSGRSRSLDPDGGRSSHMAHPTGAAGARARPRRPGYQVPIVKELPRRWDPHKEGMVRVRGTD